MATPRDLIPLPLDDLKSRVAPFCRLHGVARGSVRLPRRAASRTPEAISTSS